MWSRCSDDDDFFPLESLDVDVSDRLASLDAVSICNKQVPFQPPHRIHRVSHQDFTKHVDTKLVCSSFVSRVDGFWCVFRAQTVSQDHQRRHWTVFSQAVNSSARVSYTLRT